MRLDTCFSAPGPVRRGMLWTKLLSQTDRLILFISSTDEWDQQARDRWIFPCRTPVTCVKIAVRDNVFTGTIRCGACQQSELCFFVCVIDSGRGPIHIKAIVVKRTSLFEIFVWRVQEFEIETENQMLCFDGPCWFYIEFGPCCFYIEFRYLDSWVTIGGIGCLKYGLVSQAYHDPFVVFPLGDLSPHLSPVPCPTPNEPWLIVTHNTVSK